MSNDELRKKSEARMSKCFELCNRRFRYSDFVIRHSGLRITVCSIQKAGQQTGESGPGKGGSWVATLPNRSLALQFTQQIVWSAGNSVQRGENAAQDRGRHDDADAHNASGDDPAEILGDGDVAARDFLFFVEVRG